jgi:surface protein
MFYGCESFNQPLNDWDVSNVNDMEQMFYWCKKFNQPLNDWNVSNVTDMSWMFYKCEKFNQDLSNWDTSKLGDPWRVSDTMYKQCPIEQKYKAKNTF